MSSQLAAAATASERSCLTADCSSYLQYTYICPWCVRDPNDASNETVLLFVVRSEEEQNHVTFC